jgi:uncharacterized secreted protein with C-terminal beta-propeller domain
MTRSSAAVVALLVGASLGAGLVAGCTADQPRNSTTGQRAPGTLPAYQLVSFNDCGAALDGLRAAARANVGAWGYGRRSGRDLAQPAAPPGTAVEDRAAAGGAPQAIDGDAAKAGSASGHSGTNTHEAGVDEPDLVKTDGKRIITVQNGVLRVVDVASRAQVAKLSVGGTGAGTTGFAPEPYYATEMLFAGDKVLLIGAGGYPYRGVPADDTGKPVPQLILVDLAGTPRVVGRFGMDGSVVDARQVGAAVRVVMRSAPRIEPREVTGDVKGDPAKAYRDAMLAAIDRSGVEDWLPRYTVDNDGRVSTGRVDCDDVARPADFSAASLLTVLTFDLGKGELGNGDPVTIAADGDTVYSNGPSLYVASDHRWRAQPDIDANGKPATIEQRTEIYKFDTSKPGRPAFVAGGAVNGWLLNQYSMSDWNGHLRVATTTGLAGGREPASESTVYVLRQDGRQLGVVGQVGGLGKGERIYSVRFIGGTGYVVTFRQTDPLYAVDLRDQALPRVTGELKITGYSAYLHPAGDGRLLGIGQEANEQGRAQGTQISLFDVSDPAQPKRLAQHHVKNSHSEAEFDPHAFLYWPQTGLLVVPMHSYKAANGAGTAGALALRITDGSITELGLIEHPGAATYERTIRRSLVIDGTLWTVSAQGLLANDAQSAARLAWVQFT